MTWIIKLYENKRGEKPVQEFILSLSANSQAKVIHVIDLLEKYGNLLKMPHSKPLLNNLYELRVRGREEVRIFYTFRGSIIYLLHGFKKKGQKIPARELNTALKRLDTI